MCKNEKKIISCIIVNFNDWKLTLNLAKKLEQYDSINKVIIVDNLSIDNSFNKLKEITNDKIHIIQADKNGGYGYGNNIGIRYSNDKFNSDYIIIANPDVEFSNNCVKNLKKVLEDNEECVAVAPREEPGDKINAWSLPNTWVDIFSSELIFEKMYNLRYNKDVYSDKELFFVDVIGGAMLMVDAKSMLKYGMYDEDMFLYYEENTIGKKFKNNDLKSAILLNESFIHNHDNGTIGKNIRSNLRRRRILNHSKIIYLSRYKNFSKIKVLLLKLFFNVCDIEAMIYYTIKKLILRII